MERSVEQPRSSSLGNPLGAAHSTAARPIWLRALVLLVILCGLKLWLLGGLANHLYLTHWRVDAPAPRWADFLGFYLFAALIPVALWVVGRSLPPSEVRTIRWYNAGFLAAGLLVVFFARHRMKSNYLYPVMDGVLSVADVWHYIRQDLFFEPPYLFAYLAGYALVCWILIRTRRERLSFPILGGAGLLYLLLNLRELQVNGRDLLALDCLGLAGLICGWNTRVPLHSGWLAALFASVVAAWGFFGIAEKSLLSPDAYFVLLLSLALCFLGAALVLGRRTPAFARLSYFLPFFFFAFLLLSSRHYSKSANIDHLIVYGLTAVHYFWQETVVVLALLAGFVWLQRLAPRTALWLFDGVVLLLVLAGLVDVRLLQNMGFRLDWQTLLVNDSPILLWRTVQAYVGQLLLGIGLFVGGYFGLLFLGNRLVRPEPQPADGARFASLRFPALATGLLMLVAPLLLESDKAEGWSMANVLTTSPLVTGWSTEKLSAEEFSRQARALGLAEYQRRARATPVAPPPPRDLNVLLILLESSYNRYLSLFGAADETQPLLKKYQDRMELFPNFYSNFANSLNARFCVVSGLYACRPFVTYVNPRLSAPCLFDLFHDRGYAVSLFDSSFFDYQRWDEYLARRKIDRLYDARNMPGRERHATVSWGLAENVTLDAMKSQLARHAGKREKFFLTYMPVAPHMPFDLPSRQFDKFDNGVGHLNNDFTGRYKNQLLYMDWVLTSLLDELERLHLLDQTLVVITDDHGEMVGEDEGKLGHGWNLEPWLVNVPLILMDPQQKGRRVNPTLGSQVDILPTILDLLHWPLPPGELYQGVSLHDPAANQNKVVYLDSHRPMALVKDGRYFLHYPPSKSADQTGGSLSVFDIQQEGVRTQFRKRNEAVSKAAELDRFERFQKSLLVHYAHYREALKKTAP